MRLPSIVVFLVWTQIGCVIPYGEPWPPYISEAEDHLEPVEFRELDARLVAAIEEEQDRYIRSNLVLARELLVEAKLMPPTAQRQVLTYLEALVVASEDGRVVDASETVELEQLDIRTESLSGDQIDEGRATSVLSEEP